MPRMAWTFSPPPRVNDPDMHHACMPGSLTSGFLWCQWRGKRFRHSTRKCNPHFCVSDKRPTTCYMHRVITDPVIRWFDGMTATNMAVAVSEHFALYFVEQKYIRWLCSRLWQSRCAGNKNIASLHYAKCLQIFARIWGQVQYEYVVFVV